MKCPQCGRWNRATQTKCFYCGIPLDQNDQASTSIQPSDQPQPSSSVIYSVNQDGITSTPQPDVKDRLAKEMQSFHVQNGGDGGTEHGIAALRLRLHAAVRNAVPGVL